MANTEIPEITDDIKAKCLIRTVDDDPAMRDGAVDFVQKPVRQERLLKAIARAVTRSVSETGAVETEGAIRAKVQELTEREREIAELIGKKLTNRQISERTGITVRTVEVHRAAIIRKLGVRNPDEIERYLNA